MIVVIQLPCEADSHVADSFRSLGQLETVPARVQGAQDPEGLEGRVGGSWHDETLSRVSVSLSLACIYVLYH